MFGTATGTAGKRDLELTAELSTKHTAQLFQLCNNFNQVVLQYFLQYVRKFVSLQPVGKSTKDRQSPR